MLLWFGSKFAVGVDDKVHKDVSAATDVFSVGLIDVNDVNTFCTIDLVSGMEVVLVTIDCREDLSI